MMKTQLLRQTPYSLLHIKCVYLFADSTFNTIKSATYPKPNIDVFCLLQMKCLYQTVAFLTELTQTISVISVI